LYCKLIRIIAICTSFVRVITSDIDSTQLQSRDYALYKKKKKTESLSYLCIIHRLLKNEKLRIYRTYVLSLNILFSHKWNNGINRLTRTKDALIELLQPIFSRKTQITPVKSMISRSHTPKLMMT
jgi:hypothetical protein